MSRLLILFLCLLGVAGVEARMCGTQWLKARRADSDKESRAKHLAPQQQIHGDIEVGTQLRFRGNSFSLVTATCQHVGEHVYIFVEDKYWDTNGGLIFQRHVDQLGTLFDLATPADAAKGVYQINTETFGPVPDIDGYERIFVLVLRVRDYLATDNVVGFFDPEVPNESDPTLRLDTIYLDEETVRRNAFLAQGTLAHEFQHLIHWGLDADEESWVDEGLSGYAELINGFPETDPTMVPDFLDNPDFDLTVWLNRAANYGASYLFMAMLAERYGAALMGQLVAEARNGIFGIEGVFDRNGIDEDFRSLWGSWAVGNYAPDDPLYGYAALQGRRVRTFIAPDVPFEAISGNVTNQWGTSNIQFRRGGNIAVEFAGEEAGRYRVWLYGKQGEASFLQELTLDATNRGVGEVLHVDSLVVIVGRTSPQGPDFTLAAHEAMPTDVAELANVQPRAIELDEVYPNPFNGYAIIPFDVPDAVEVELSLYNSGGQKVRVLRRGVHEAGRYEVVWNGLNGAGEKVGSGVYQAVLRVGERRLVRKLSLVK